MVVKEYLFKVNIIDIQDYYFLSWMISTSFIFIALYNSKFYSYGTLYQIQWKIIIIYNTSKKCCKSYASYPPPPFSQWSATIHRSSSSVCSKLQTNTDPIIPKNNLQTKFWVFIVKVMPKINAKPRSCKQTFGDPCQFIEI